MLKKFIIALLLFVCAFVCSSGTAAQQRAKIGGQDDARTLIERSIQAIGGTDRLRNAGVLRIEGLGLRNEIASHDLPGMDLSIFFKFTELHDAANGRWQIEQEGLGPFGGRGAQRRTVVGGVAATSTGGQIVPAGGTAQDPFGGVVKQQAEEALWLGPEHILLTALEAHDLRSERDEVVEGAAQRVLTFHWKDAAVRLLVCAENNLPSEVDVTREHPYDAFLGAWGIFTTATHYSRWAMLKGGLQYPLEWRSEMRGRRFMQLNLSQVETNFSVSTDDFKVPESVAAAARSTPLKTIDEIALIRPAGAPHSTPPKEIAPGIILFPGVWHVVLVKQDDGVIVIEAPTSSGYSTQVIRESERRFPGVRLKAMISTSDAPSHFGGAREYVARGVPIFLREVNRRSLVSLIASRRHVLADSLSRAPKPAQFRVVEARTIVGTGANRIEIYPVRAADGERSLMVYFPEHHLLYCADVSLPGPFFPGVKFTALIDAVEKEHLNVETVIGIHQSGKSWQEIIAEINAFSK